MSSRWLCRAFQAARAVSGVTVPAMCDLSCYVAPVTLTGSSRVAARSRISSSGPSARRLAGTPASGPERTPATALAFAAPTARMNERRAARSTSSVRLTRSGGGFGRVVHRDAHLAPDVQRRGVGEERGGVPVLPETQKREIERRDAVRSDGDAPADLARVGARGLLRRASGRNLVGERPGGLEQRLGQQAVVRLRVVGRAPGARRRATARPPPSRRPGWPTARRWRGAWCPPPATGAPRGPGPGRRRSPRPAARPPGRWLAAGCR